MTGSLLAVISPYHRPGRHGLVRRDGQCGRAKSCYGAPVKLCSINILLLAVFLFAPDLARLFSILVLNYAAAPDDLIGPRFSRRWMLTPSTAFWVLLVGYNLVGHVTPRSWKSFKKPNGPLGLEAGLAKEREKMN